MSRHVVYLVFLLLITPSLKGQDSLMLPEDALSGDLLISAHNGSQRAASGICGEFLDTPFSVSVSDQWGSPVEGVEVACKIIHQPEKSAGASLSGTALNHRSYYGAYSGAHQAISGHISQDGAQSFSSRLLHPFAHGMHSEKE